MATIVTRYNPDSAGRPHGSVKEVKVYTRSKKDRKLMADESYQHTLDFKTGKVGFKTGLW